MRGRNCKLASALYVSALCVCLSATALAAEKKQHQLPSTSQRINVDGNLDEAAWDQALQLELAYETRPRENLPARVNTTVFLLEDGRHLLIGFKAFDPEPQKIRAFFHDRDAAWDDDFVGVILDTFNDERRAYEFFSNALGAQMDVIQDDLTGNEDSSWDAIWRSAGRITEFGYSVEMKIPLASMNFPGTNGGQTWGLDVIRFHPREVTRRLSISAIDRNINCHLCQIGKLSGFKNAKPGRDLEINPTLTATSATFREDPAIEPLPDPDNEAQAGIDVNWGINPSLSLNATLNPDFSQVEADVAQLEVNTSFALFFPEKRPFFLENADFFRTLINTVHTRNVADPDYGIKLTGKSDAYAYGVFASNDTTTSFLIPGNQSSSVANIDSPSDDAAFRLRRDLGERSAVGLVATHRGADGYLNDTIGIDGKWGFTDSDQIVFQWLATRTEYPQEIVEEYEQSDDRLQGNGLLARYSHNSRDWLAYVAWRDFDREFRADLGFNGRADYDKLVIGLGRFWWGGDNHWWDKIQVSGDWDITHDDDGNFLERELEGGVRFEGPLQSSGRIDLGVRDMFFEGLRFDQQYASFSLNMTPRAGIRIGIRGRFGDQLDFSNARAGEITQFRPNVNLNIGRHLSARLDHRYETLDVTGGRLFTANVSDLRLKWQFSNRSFVRWTVQRFDITRDPVLYIEEEDARTRTLGNQLLYSYKLNPRTVFFAGYSDHSLDNDDLNRLKLDSQTLFIKLGYAWQPE